MGDDSNNKYIPFDASKTANCLAENLVPEVMRATGVKDVFVGVGSTEGGGVDLIVKDGRTQSPEEKGAFERRVIVNPNGDANVFSYARDGNKEIGLAAIRNGATIRSGKGWDTYVKPDGTSSRQEQLKKTEPQRNQFMRELDKIKPCLPKNTPV